MGEPEIHVVESGRAVFISIVGNLMNQPVGIGRASGYKESGFVTAKRAFYRQSRIEWADAARSGNIFLVPVAGGHVEYGRQSAAIFFGNAALIELHAFYHIGIERREESEEMCWVIDGGCVEQYEVLVN